ncbi:MULTISPECIES: sugar transferase [unclassified Nitratiruptor]|uniref:sugar transferase n=1 Tax=unclassified Nitratiruptor TaxID=2624044 RepID=UPI0019161B7F|nr:MULTISPECIES: sugar transferase [unclassified Nitratiruptor]
MKIYRYLSPLLLFLFDALTIVGSIVLAYESREIFISTNDISLIRYLTLYVFYLPLIMFIYEGLYHYRYDFWQECKLILRALLLSFLIVLSYLALTKSIDNYSRFVVVLAFIYMTFFIPLQKRLVKWLLYSLGIWKKEAKLLGSDPFLEKNIFDNYYVGYVPAKNGSDTVFIDPHSVSLDSMDTILKSELRKHHELYFMPIIRDFNLTQSQIFEFFNSRSNLILLQNRLQSRVNIATKEIFDKSTAFLLLIALLPFIGMVVIIKIFMEPRTPIFYKQRRLGKDGKEFYLLKFRTMHVNANEILEAYFQKHPEKKEEWERYKKLKDDPRVTPLGRILRKYSIDELPQLFNVLRGEMSLIGPRPYIPDELEKLASYKEEILLAKPGITGLWQVLGRNSLSFEERMAIDRWYVYNWSLWNDFVILLKTFRAVLEKEKTS